MKSRRLRELAMMAWRMSHCPEAKGQEMKWFESKYAELILHECFHALHLAGYGEAVEPVKKHFLEEV
jgi:hypothetical protein